MCVTFDDVYVIIKFCEANRREEKWRSDDAWLQQLLYKLQRSWHCSVVSGGAELNRDPGNDPGEHDLLTLPKEQKLQTVAKVIFSTQWDQTSHDKRI